MLAGRGGDYRPYVPLRNGTSGARVWSPPKRNDIKCGGHDGEVQMWESSLQMWGTFVINVRSRASG